MEKTVTFRNGQQVPALGQGTYRMGNSGANRNEEIKALRTGIDLGLTVIDTAEYYDNEELVGEAIHGVRDKLFLVSKVLPNHANKQETIIQACENSLRKLGTDVLDLYLLHWEGRSSFQETVRAMTRLEEQGKIKMWGVSNMDVPEMERFFAIDGGKTCAVNQVAYNLSYRGTEFDLMPWCAERNVVLMAYSPLNEGSLPGHNTLIQIGERHNATAAQIALAWSIRNPNLLSIPKASTPKRVAENFKSLSIQLTEEDLNELDTAFPPPARKVPLAVW